MSTRFSHSPELHLRIASSRHCFALQSIYLLAATAAVASVWLGGRSELAVLLVMGLGCSLPRLIGQPATGTVVAWHAGCWALDSGSGARPIALCDGCRVTPWVIVLAWREPGGYGGRLWIFADAVDRDGWRRLRVRLRLQG